MTPREKLAGAIFDLCTFWVIDGDENELASCEICGSALKGSLAHMRRHAFKHIIGVSNEEARQILTMAALGVPLHAAYLEICPPSKTEE